MSHILLVEDTKIVADAIRDTLETQGWRVQTCADGLVASLLIKGEAHYDLFLLDNELPNISGLELTRLARGLAHRKQTSIIMLSATECGRATRRAGADAFIRKPEGVGQIIETVARLLTA
jgi:DNA-binding response OmpR family regulator